MLGKEQNSLFFTLVNDDGLFKGIIHLGLQDSNLVY